MCVIMLNFIKIGRTVSDKRWFDGFFSKWRPSAILDLLGAYWDHPRWPLGGVYHYSKFVKINAVVSITWNFQYFVRLAWKRLFTPQKLRFWGISRRKWGAISTKPPKGTSAGRSGSSGVLIMSLAVIVPEKSRGNKKCDKEEEEEERQIFGLFRIAVKWPWHGCVQLFLYLCVHSVEDSTLMPIFDQFCFPFLFLGLPKIGPNRYT